MINDHNIGDDEGDAVAGAVHREQQDCAAAGDAVLGAAARAGVRGPVQAGQHRVLQTRHGRQVAREVHRAHAGHHSHPVSVNHNSQYCRMFMATLTTSDNQRIILQIPRTLSK